MILKNIKWLQVSAFFNQKKILPKIKPTSVKLFNITTNRPFFSKFLLHFLQCVQVQSPTNMGKYQPKVQNDTFWKFLPYCETKIFVKMSTTTLIVWSFWYLVSGIPKWPLTIPLVTQQEAQSRYDVFRQRRAEIFDLTYTKWLQQKENIFDQTKFSKQTFTKFMPGDLENCIETRQNENERAPFWAYPDLNLRNKIRDYSIKCSFTSKTASIQTFIGEFRAVVLKVLEYGNQLLLIALLADQDSASTVRENCCDF